MVKMGKSACYVLKPWCWAGSDSFPSIGSGLPSVVSVGQSPSRLLGFTSQAVNASVTRQGWCPFCDMWTVWCWSRCSSSLSLSCLLFGSLLFGDFLLCCFFFVCLFWNERGFLFLFAAQAVVFVQCYILLGTSPSAGRPFPSCFLCFSSIIVINEQHNIKLVLDLLAELLECRNV